MNASFWRGKRVLVTGHTGFKGSWLCELLLELGAEVGGYALEPPMEPSLFRLQELADRIDHAMGDVRDIERLARRVDTLAPEIVFHLAAQSLVRQGYKDPVETFSTNVMGTVNLLDVCRRQAGLRALVVVTSDKCYEERRSSGGYREDDALGGVDPYASSKACSELVVAAYRASFFKSVDRQARAQAGRASIATARAGNVIGGGDWGIDRLIPDLVRAFMDERPASIRYPGSVRPWQHVLDALHGYLILAERLAREGASYAGAWNFGPLLAEMLTVAQVADRMCKLWPYSARWETTPDTGPHEAASLFLDPSKARTRLGWDPVLQLDEALEMTSQWYAAYASASKEDVAGLTRKQAIEFIKRVSPAETTSSHD